MIGPAAAAAPLTAGMTKAIVGSTVMAVGVQGVTSICTSAGQIKTAELNMRLKAADMDAGVPGHFSVPHNNAP